MASLHVFWRILRGLSLGFGCSTMIEVLVPTDTMREVVTVLGDWHSSGGDLDLTLQQWRTDIESAWRKLPTHVPRLPRCQYGRVPLEPLSGWQVLLPPRREGRRSGRTALIVALERLFWFRRGSGMVAAAATML